jgi:superfamily II DNA or RNA helicase
MATGSGKTALTAALSLILYLNKLQVLVIVPSKDLVNQTVAEFRSHLRNYPLTIGEYSGGTKDMDHPIVICSWQAMQNAPHYMKDVSAVVCDESHGIKAEVIRKLINEHGAHISHRYGVTGTFPKPLTDQYTLKLSIGRIVREVRARWLIDQGYLSEIEITPVETVDDDPEMPDYVSERAWLTNNSERNAAIAKLIKECTATYGNTMVLVNTQALQQGRDIAELIEGAVFLDGSSKTDLRQENYNSYAERDDIMLIASAGIASTGISIDRMFCLILLDTGKSFVKCIQSVGRGMRKKGDKNKIVVIDIYSKLKFAKKHFKARKEFYAEAEYPLNVIKKLKY